MSRKVSDLVRTVFDQPDMPDEVVELILWGTTGFPSFLTGDRVKCLYYQLHHAKRSLARGFDVDDIYLGIDQLKRGQND